jgi:hypothetical protein
MVAISFLILVFELARHHDEPEIALLLGPLVPVALAACWLLRDLHAHPANFPQPASRTSDSSSWGEVRELGSVTDSRRQPA